MNNDKGNLIETLRIAIQDIEGISDKAFRGLEGSLSQNVYELRPLS